MQDVFVQCFQNFNLPERLFGSRIAYDADKKSWSSLFSQKIEL